MPRVSVIVPVYNRAIFVGAAIESILAQTFADFELIVIDDGSIDATPDMVRSFADPRIRLVRHERNLGIPAARNSGLAAARGEYAATLDSDDIAHPKRLERQAAFLDAHPDHALVGSWTADMDENGRPLGKIRRKPTSPADVRAKLLFGGSVTNSTIMGRTEILRRYGYREEFRVRQDYDLFVRLSEHYPIANLPEALVWVRRHPGQETKCQAAQVFERSAEVIKHQLRSLGVRFDERDVARHYVLPRLGRDKLSHQGVPVRVDAGFQDWTEAWLHGLARANRWVGLYDDRALRELIGWLWLRTAWYAFRLRGWAAWRAFLSSDLAWLLVPALRDRLGRRLPQRWEPAVRRLAGAPGTGSAGGARPVWPKSLTAAGLLLLFFAGGMSSYASTRATQLETNRKAAVLIVDKRIVHRANYPEPAFDPAISIQDGETFLVSGTVRPDGAWNADRAERYVGRVRFVCEKKSLYRHVAEEDREIRDRCAKVDFLQIGDRILIH